MCNERKVFSTEYENILRVNNLNPSCERLEMIKTGCQLGTLYEEDILYIADPSTSIHSAQRRLTTRRREY